ncbi:MAG: hypothetical protein RR228_00565 [Bacilli bacterium]
MSVIDIYYIEDLEKIRGLKENENHTINLFGNLFFHDIDSYRYASSYFKFLEEYNKDKELYKGFEPIDLKGELVEFYGYKHLIKDLFINRESENNVGLFNCCKNTIFNVYELDIENAMIKGKDNVGILAGTMNGEVDKCNIEGVVEGISNVGALVGKSSKYFFTAQSPVKANVLGQSIVGQIIGNANIVSTYNQVFDGFANVEQSNKIVITENVCGVSKQYNDTFGPKLV